MTTGQAEGFRQRRAISLATARQAIADHDGGGPRRRIEDSGRYIISMSVEKPGFAITPGYRELPTQVVVKGDGTKERFQRIHGPTDTGMAWHADLEIARTSSWAHDLQCRCNGSGGTVAFAALAVS